MLQHMGRKPISDEAHAAMVASFRERPGDVRAAAEASGLDPRTCRKAWQRGLRGERALQDVVAEERVMAKAELSKAGLMAKLREAPVLAKLDAVEAAT